MVLSLPFESLTPSVGERVVDRPGEFENRHMTENRSDKKRTILILKRTKKDLS
jgi:hypothetical protein